MSKQKLFFYSLIGLASIGILTSLWRNPAGLFLNLFITAVIIAIVSYVIIRFSGNGSRGRSKDQRLFVKAARQSRKRSRNRSPQLSMQKNGKKSIQRKKSSAQLTVIEGKKQKKNNRNANF